MKSFFTLNNVKLCENSTVIYCRFEIKTQTPEKPKEAISAM